MKLGLYIQTVVVVCFCAGGNIASIETAENLKTPKFATRNPSRGKLGLDTCATGLRTKTLGKHMAKENIGNISGL